MEPVRIVQIALFAIALLLCANVLYYKRDTRLGWATAAIALGLLLPVLVDFLSGLEL